jgi:hypothetical protein
MEKEAKDINLSSLDQYDHVVNNSLRTGQESPLFLFKQILRKIEQQQPHLFKSVFKQYYRFVEGDIGYLDPECGENQVFSVLCLRMWQYGRIVLQTQGELSSYLEEWGKLYAKEITIFENHRMKS